MCVSDLVVYGSADVIINNNNNNKTYIAPISIRLFSSALKNVKLETI